MNKKVDIDFGLVNLAIEELRTKNQKITLGAISKLTDIPYHILYASGRFDGYVNNYKPQKSVTITRPIEKIDLEQDVQVYMQYIRENYFSHAESIEAVSQDMLVNTNFIQPVFHQAINLLRLNGELVETHLKQGHFIGHFIDTDPPVQIIDSTDSQDQPWGFAGNIEATLEHIPVEEPKQPVQAEKELPSIEMMEMEFDLTHGKFRVEFPSQLTTEDVEDMKTLLNMLTKRRIVD
ncbi:hypothetical protein [Burkholderia contaminans]|uniref:hypothetical protein n=1 Tax=Burkholderia contaminans TaxID=488447 RepID=UPI00158BD17E|nr:hypothetical protein [Burkholderia contaminans]